MCFIGVIDSGVGGLTVLNKIRQSFSYNYCYIADHAFCPYGIKSNKVIFSRIVTLIKYLQLHGAQAVVLACNTMSTFAQDLQTVCDIPVYDVITPTCLYIANYPHVRRVALLATHSTISNGVYRKILSKYGVEVVDFDCSGFVPYVEQCATATVSCSDAVKNALRHLPVTQADAAILGCTHFPLLRNQIAQYCNGKLIVECRCNLPNNLFVPTLQPTLTCLTTGKADLADKAAKWFGDAQFKHIDL